MGTQQYIYLDAEAQPIYRVLRVDNKDGTKTFLQQRRTQTGWTNGLDGVDYVLYNLPVVIESDEVWFVEGEKCADALMAINISATTKSGGAGRGWTEKEIRTLEGKHVVISPDNDAPGAKYWQNAVRHLVGVAASIRLLELEGLAEGEDVYDWLERGGSRETLLALAKRARQVGLADLPAPPAPKPEPRLEPDRAPVNARHDRDDIRACLNLITVHDRDTAVAVMLSIKHAGGTLQDFLEWRSRQPIGNGHFDKTKAAGQWRVAKPQGGANFGKLVSLAKETDPNFVTPSFLVELEQKAMMGMLGEADLPPWEEATAPAPKLNGHLNGHTRPTPKPVDVKEVFDPWREVYAPEFPLELVPPDIRGYITARSEETGACMSAVAMSCLAVASGAITHEAKLYLKKDSHFPVSPRLWVALVGDPSAKKSPAISGAMKALQTWQSAVQADQMRQWEDEVRDLSPKERKEYPRPKLTHFVVNDVTPEALADILSRQDRGTLVHADELAGWIGGMDRYGSGKGGSSGRGMWLEAYNGGEQNIHRISRPTARVNNLSVSILGGIQPDRLRDLGNLTSDGLLQRFLPVMMRKSRVDKDTFNTMATRDWEMRVRDLADYGAFSTSLSPDAAQERRRIVDTVLARAQKVTSEGAGWQGFAGKLDGVWGNVALLLHILWGHRAADKVTLETAQRASHLIEEFIIPHGLAFYESVAGRSAGDNRAIGAFIANFKEPVITARHFVRGPACFRNGSTDDVVDKLGPFVAGGWLTPVMAGPANNSWKITQGLNDRFAKEAEAHNSMVAEIRSKFRDKDD